MADELILRGFDDPEPVVRLAAYRSAGFRESRDVRARFVAILRTNAIDQLSQEEQRLLVASAVAAVGTKLIPLLKDILLKGGLLAFLSRRLELRLAAAHGLGQIGTPKAKEALRLGARKGSRRIRKACIAALEARSGMLARIDRSTRLGPLGPRPDGRFSPPPPRLGTEGSGLRRPSSQAGLPDPISVDVPHLGAVIPLEPVGSVFEEAELDGGWLERELGEEVRPRRDEGDGVPGPDAARPRCEALWPVALDPKALLPLDPPSQDLDLPTLDVSTELSLPDLGEEP